MSDNQLLFNALRSLPPTGMGSFEELIAQLLEVLTDQRYRLARSGSQEGRDLSTHPHRANVVAVECKRYQKDTELEERPLIGEIVQAARDMPDLDLWVLVTTRNVDSTLYTALERTAEDYNLAFLPVSTADGSPSSLEILCANAPEVVFQYVGAILANADVQSLRVSLSEIAASSSFEECIAQLRETLLSPLVGYDAKRKALNSSLLERFRSTKVSRAAFGQEIHVVDNEVFINRSTARAELDVWYDNWGDRRTSIAVLGEEGDGKTWLVSSWLAKRLQEDGTFPTTVFLTSINVFTDDPLDLLTKAIRDQLRVEEGRRFHKRVERWFGVFSDKAPRFLLVLDGINERHSPQLLWRSLLEKLQGEKLFAQVAVLITCRATFWEKYFAPLRSIEVTTYTLTSYDDQELRKALALHNLRDSDIPEQLSPLIRKPRYFDLMIKHRVRIAESGDVTVARLIYEDWKDRYERKRGILTDEEFQGLIRGMAQRSLQADGYLTQKEISDMVPVYIEQQALFEELRTGGILYGSAGRFQVGERMLTFGLGLLLADQVGRDGQSWDELKENLAEWLEPHSEMDIKAAICESATLHALSLPEYPGVGKLALLHTWISSQNLSPNMEDSFPAYFPLAPKSYTDLMELMWAESHSRAWIHRLLMKTLLRWQGETRIQDHLRVTFERWLGFVYLYGSPYDRDRTPEEKEKGRKRTSERLGSELHLGPYSIGDYQLTVVDDDGLIRLARAALAVISHLPRSPFITGMATGCLAEAVMGFPNNHELYRWVMCSAPQSEWQVVEQEARRLMSTDSRVAKQAAARLLAHEGSTSAYQLRKALPEDLFPAGPLYEHHQADPCRSGFAWTRAVCEQCLQREDLQAQWVARQIAKHCVDPDFHAPPDIGQRFAPLVETINLDELWIFLALTEAEHRLEQYEPGLCAYAPMALVELIRRIAYQVGTREGMPLRQLSYHLKHYSLILQDEQYAHIRAAWERLISQSSAWEEQDRETEIGLFALVLIGSTAEEQLRYLTQRPKDAWDLIDYIPLFKQLTNWELVQELLNDAEGMKVVERTLWFLSVNPYDLPPVVMEEILPLLEHPESLLRFQVLQLLFFLGAEVAQVAVDSGWMWESEQKEMEKHWGSLVIGRYGTRLSYDELRQRIHPSYLGYAVECRGNIPEEINRYAADIHRVWSLLGADIPDLPLDFPSSIVDSSLAGSRTEVAWRRLAPEALTQGFKFIGRQAYWGELDPAGEEDFEHFLGPDRIERQEAREEALRQIARDTIRIQHEAGNVWFADDFPQEGLDEVVHRHPTLVEEWLAAALSGEPDAKRRVGLASSFYETLCIVLLKQLPDKGVELYERLRTQNMVICTRDRDTKFWPPDYHLFDMPPSPSAEAAWQKRLANCNTDEMLMEVATLAQLGKAMEWLLAYIDEGLQSTEPFKWSRAVTLLGFVDDVAADQHLAELYLLQPDTWRRDLVQTVQQRWKTNSWARYWFHRFLTVAEDEMAWAAFRLLLHVADRRFWLWYQQVREQADPTHYSPKRKQFFKHNLEKLRNSIERNERPFREHFLGQKVLKNEVWPWMS